MPVILRLSFRTVLALTCILIIIPLMGICWLCGRRRAARRIMSAAFAAGARAWGIRIRVQGELAQDRPLILVSNHFTYLDLFVMGSRIPAAFTPKSEIRSWPVIGAMSAASGCLFIDRRPSQTLANKRNLEEALAAGDIISLFPEGTTNDGTQVLPFKSSFFSLAMESGTKVQPASVVYTALNGKPLDAAARPVIGWYGDFYFFPHVAHFLRQESVDATLIFHPPVNPRDFTCRKDLAAHCRSVIEKPLQGMIESFGRQVQND